MTTEWLVYIGPNGVAVTSNADSYLKEHASLVIGYGDDGLSHPMVGDDVRPFTDYRLAKETERVWNLSRYVPTKEEIDSSIAEIERGTA